MHRELNLRAMFSKHEIVIKLLRLYHMFYLLMLFDLRTVKAVLPKCFLKLTFCGIHEFQFADPLC